MAALIMANYAILRFSKRQAGGVASADRHNERKKAAYKSNPNIDQTKSHLNYHLVQPNGTYKQKCSEIIRNAGCKIRSNSVVMVETLITASPEFMNAMSRDEQRRFFERALEFIGERVGTQNIFSAVVHMDETTPHMHLCFCPVTSDGRLSAKDILGNRKGCSEWQDMFFERMSRSYPSLSRGISSRITHRKHIPAYVFKQATELDKAYPKIVEALNDITAFNSGKKRNEAMKILSQYTGKMKRFSERMRDTEDYIRELETARKRLEEETDLQGQELANTRIDLAAREAEIQRLYAQMRQMQKLLDMIPEQILETVKTMPYKVNAR